MTGRADPRRACRALFFGIGVFCAIQAALLLVSGRLMPWITEPVYGRKLALLRLRLKEHPSPALVVAIGSSRTLNGVRGDAIEPVLEQALGRPVTVFNAGVPGADCVANRLYLRRLLHDDIRPSLVLLETPLPLLLRHDGDDALRENVCSACSLRRDEFRLVPRHSSDSEPPSRTDWAVARAVPIYAHRFSLMSQIAPGFLPFADRLDQFNNLDRWGWIAFPAVGPEKRAARRKEALRLFADGLKAGKLSEPRVNALRETLALCRREHIAAAILVMPEGPAFRGSYPPGIAERLGTLLRNTAREFDAAVLWTRDWMDEEAFNDSSHLLPEAAARFSRRLATEQLLPLLQQPPNRGAGL